MPRKAKPPRLWLRHRPGRSSTWVILDRGKETPTGCLQGDDRGAEEALARYIGKKYTPPRRSGLLDEIPVTEIMTCYMREHAPTKPRSIDFLIATSRPIEEWWSDKYLSDVKAKSCTDYVAWRVGQGVSDQTARHDLKTLRAAIKYYHANHGPLQALPVVTLPPRRKGRVRWLTRGEMAALLWHSRRVEHLKRVILIGYYSGTRSGAIFAMRWIPSTVGGHFDLTEGIMYRMADGEAESKKAKPSAKIHRRLLPFLRRWRAKDMALGQAVVCHYQGGAIEKLRRSWDSARVAAGLGKDVTPHVLRHTCVTWLLQAGVPIFEVAGFVGMSPETVEKVYGHHSPDFQNRAAGFMGGAMIHRNRSERISNK